MLWKKFAESTGKLICLKLFLIKFDLRSATLSQQASFTGVFMWTFSVVTQKEIAIL